MCSSCEAAPRRGEHGGEDLVQCSADARRDADADADETALCLPAFTKRGLVCPGASPAGLWSQ